MAVEKQEIQFRSACFSDLDEIVRLVREAVETMERNGILQWDEIYPERGDFQRDIENNHLSVGVIDDRIAVVYAVNAECDKQYQNGCWSFPDSSFRVIHRLCVHPDFQNNGVARKTLRHIEDSLMALGIETIRLDAFTENPYALRLYEHLGYERVGTADWRKGKFYLMEKRLA